MRCSRRNAGLIGYVPRGDLVGFLLEGAAHGPALGPYPVLALPVSRSSSHGLAHPHHRLPAGARAGISLIRVPIPRNPAGLGETLAAAEKERVQAIGFGLNYSLVGAGWQKIRSWAICNNVLTSSAVDSGAMVRFGTNPVHFTALFADQLDRVLRGANPADLPILQPTRFDLVIDRGQLREMGLTVSRSVLLQATEVID